MPRVAELWLEFEVWAPDDNDDPENDFCNVLARLEDGSVYAFNVWTFKFFDTVREQEREQRYVVAPDLFVERLDRATLEAAIGDLAAQDALPSDCHVTDSELLADYANGFG